MNCFPNNTPGPANLIPTTYYLSNYFPFPSSHQRIPATLRLLSPSALSFLTTASSAQSGLLWKGKVIYLSSSRTWRSLLFFFYSLHYYCSSASYYFSSSPPPPPPPLPTFSPFTFPVMAQWRYPLYFSFFLFTLPLARPTFALHSLCLVSEVSLRSLRLCWSTKKEKN